MTVENVEWLNQNLLRAYPIREDADVIPYITDDVRATGLQLPTCLISDFAFTLDFASFDGDVPCLTKVIHAAEGFSFEISLGDVVLATVTAAITSGVNSVHRVYGAGDNADCGGWLVTGDLAKAAKELPEGVYMFKSGQLPFEVSTLRLAPRGVRSITAVGKYGLKTYAPLYGNVKIIAGSDMSVRNTNDTNAIWLNAESNTGYERTEPCECGTESTKKVNSINGMSVDDVTIIGDGVCVNVNETNTDSVKTISIADGCATPCCGCQELNFVEAAVATINKSISVLNSYAEVLQNRVTELQTNITTTQASLASYPHRPATTT